MCITFLVRVVALKIKSDEQECLQDGGLRNYGAMPVESNGRTPIDFRPCNPMNF